MDRDATAREIRNAEAAETKAEAKAEAKREDAAEAKALAKAQSDSKAEKVAKVVTPTIPHFKSWGEREKFFMKHPQLRPKE